MEQIKIQTGANLSRLLQSTVNIPQAFTELVKNSIQNFSTFSKIDFDSSSVTVIDDGQGFDHVKDEKGMSGFEKYFVFGNSYDMTGGKGVKLGQMGIGGKLANDKLSNEIDIHWIIETKNIHGKCFIVEYKPSGVEFLNDYSPELTEISPEECSILTESGTKITIATLKDHIQKEGWPSGQIKNELCTFFGFLLPQLEKEGKKFDLILNGESLDFSYKLPGSNIPIIRREFEYDYYGEKRTSNIEFRLSLIYNRGLIKNHPLKNIEIISKVKICSLNFSDQDLLESTLEWLEEKNKEEIKDKDKIYDVFNKLIGFISCDDLSEVMDSTGMPAKDLSHHGLRSDHPITNPFYERVYKVLLEWIVEYIKLNSEEKMNILDALANEVSSMLAEYFEDEDFSDLWDTEEEEDDEEPEELTEEEKKEEEERKELEKFAELTIDKEWVFEPEPEEELEPEPEEDEEPKPEDNVPPLWNKYKNQKLKQSKRLRYRIIDFGEEEAKSMSKVDDISDFTILINNGNPKFKRFYEENSPFLLSLHISELLIREISMYKNPLAKPADLDEAISDFYSNKYAQIKKKSE